jgi:hypothetical protein
MTSVFSFSASRAHVTVTRAWRVLTYLEVATIIVGCVGIIIIIIMLIWYIVISCSASKPTNDYQCIDTPPVAPPYNEKWNQNIYQ